jgi:WD40 repeat protein/TPR repeat protein
MSYLLLLVNSDGQATTSRLVIRELREFPGGEGVSVHFRPVRNDLLFESAKVAGRLAYRILSGEGIVRSQLWVEYEVLGPHVNVTGRSSDLLFALALVISKWKKATGHYPAVAATGVLDQESAALAREPTVAVQGVKHTVEKVAAAVSSLIEEPEALVFYPAADAESVATWSVTADIPAHIRLHPVESLEDALFVLGISLEKVYLGNPFRGLEHFDYQHRAIFFGRDSEVSELLRQLLRREAAGSPGLLVEGASGSGKSSFLRAGVLPALVHPGSQPTDIEQALRIRPVQDTVRWAIWRVGLLPSAADEACIAQSICDCWRALPELTGCLDGDPLTLSDLVKLRRQYWPAEQRFVWVLDQFEELLTVGVSESEIDTLGRFLIALQSDGVWTLASIRADALAQLKQHQSLRQVFGSNEGQYYLGPITATALDDVINRPAHAAGLNFGMGPSGRRLDQILREDAYLDRENALPLLQFTLYELYQRRSGKELTYKAYEQLGGLSGSVATTADAVLKAEAVDLQRALPHLFRILVNVDEVGGAFRRYAPIAEIAQDPAQKRLLLRLVEARLCVTDQREGEAVVAFAHEALLRTWPVLIDWLQQEAGLLQTRELAQRETRLWQQHGQSDDWLAAADKLAAFKQLETAGIALSEPVGTFIDRSARRVRRTTRVKRAAVGAITLLAIAASGAGWIASRKQQEAQYQATQALQSQARLLTEAAAQRLRDSDMAGAQGIILEVLTNREFAQGYTPASINVFQEIRAADAQLAVLSGHGGNIRSATYSPDGTRIVTASLDKTARIWDARTGAQLAVLSGHGSFNYSAYSPDGTRIVTALGDKTARIWDAVTGTQLAVLSGHSEWLSSAAYSPDGARIVTASQDKTARVWDARTGASLVVLSGHSEWLLSAGYSPDGTHIVTASQDKTARVWDARTGSQLAVLSGHGGRVNSAAYSPDGTRIVTASQDRTARVWDANTGASLAVLSGHNGIVSSAAYSPDGTRIVTSSNDKTARVWDAVTGMPLAVLSGHSGIVNSVTYSPDGTRIVTASQDETVRVWDARTRAQLAILLAHGSSVFSAVYSPDGNRIVTASNDKTARIWDVRTAAPLAVLSGHGYPLSSAAYSPDGTRIVTASDDKTARIWDADTSEQLATLSAQDAYVNSAAYSPDGTRIVTALADKTARIWDVRTAATLAVLSGHGDVVMSAAYSPDGTRIVTASLDKTVRTWDAHTGAPLAVLYGHGDRVVFVAYSPDGARVVSASGDKTARIWDARTGTQITVLSGHGGVVTSAAYSPDGARIVTSSGDKTARIWDARTGTQLAVLSGHGDVVESAAYSPDGTRIVTGSDDKTARIWDARVPANIAAQIMWGAAAQSDPLSDVDRTQLGLLPGDRVRKWRVHGSMCDQAAAAFYDPDRLAPGLAQATIVANVANSACSREIAKTGNSSRLIYQLGRALLAKSDVQGARRQFEIAVAEGYPAARIDLANLLMGDSAGAIDLKRVVSLYERAWEAGVPIAAVDLGHLHEYGNGAHGATTAAGVAFQPDPSKAWLWYQKGADLGEPNALARFAERDERTALVENDPSKRNALLLQSFRYYAAAAERAYIEDWPDEAWRHWRYRRATLARLLAREGMMQQVADAYASIRALN